MPTVEQQHHNGEIVLWITSGSDIGRYLSETGEAASIDQAKKFRRDASISDLSSWATSMGFEFAPVERLAFVL